MGVMEPAISTTGRGGQPLPTSRWVGFEIASQAFALRIGCVREVVLSASVDPVPGAPRLVLGVAALRGRIVSVLDLHGRLQIEPPPRDAGSGDGHCLIVVESAGEPLALRVDRIGQLYSLEGEHIKPPPRVAAPGVDEAVTGHVAFDDSLLTLLDLDALVDPIALG
ncbi:chemotaxis protein CheW [Hydrocarboniphaga sp.]|uniref:chemotaxis protein CheW n=1 Tax=Hydrocarboniphaga sp. TaxID=2033016 RepID=UPI003D14E1A6